MKALIIDDEAIARLELRRLLENQPGLEIHEAANADEALACCAAVNPGLLFLDINLPGCTGFDFLQRLEPPHPAVIFTTAHDAHALRAFDSGALDYLLKPIEPERLAQACRRVAGWGLSTDEASPPTKELRMDDKVFVRDGERCWFVLVAEIVRLEGEGGVTRLHFNRNHATLSRTLVEIERRLPPGDFLRVNRNEIINLNHIVSLEPWFSGSLKAHLANGYEVEFSRRQAQVFRERRAL